MSGDACRVVCRVVCTVLFAALSRCCLFAAHCLALPCLAACARGRPLAEGSCDKDGVYTVRHLSSTAPRGPGCNRARRDARSLIKQGTSERGLQRERQEATRRKQQETRRGLPRTSRTTGENCSSQLPACTRTKKRSKTSMLLRLLCQPEHAPGRGKRRTRWRGTGSSEQRGGYARCQCSPRTFCPLCIFQLGNRPDHSV